MCVGGEALVGRWGQPEALFPTESPLRSAAHCEASPKIRPKDANTIS